MFLVDSHERDCMRESVYKNILLNNVYVIKHNWEKHPVVCTSSVISTLMWILSNVKGYGDLKGNEQINNNSDN